MRRRAAVFLALLSGCAGEELVLEPVDWEKMGTIRALAGADVRFEEDQPWFYFAGEGGGIARWDGESFGLVDLATSTHFSSLVVRHRTAIAAGCSEGGFRGELFSLAVPETETWAPIPLPFDVPCLRSITAIGGEYLVAGDEGTILRSIGGRWERVAIDTPVRLSSISAPAIGEFAMAAGERGTILLLENQRWRTMPKIVDRELFAVFVQSARTAFAVGEGGTILRFDGTAWTELPSPTTRALRSIYSAYVRINPFRDPIWTVLIAGDLGTMLVLDVDEFRPIKVRSNRDLHVVWGSSDPRTGAYAGGANGTLLELVFHEVE